MIKNCIEYRKFHPVTTTIGSNPGLRKLKAALINFCITKIIRVRLGKSICPVCRMRALGIGIIIRRYSVPFSRESLFCFVSNDSDSSHLGVETKPSCPLCRIALNSVTWTDFGFFRDYAEKDLFLRKSACSLV